eukprot:scaffold2645_cov378-Prasinococcus_capsulatus_cf.AAC.13
MHVPSCWPRFWADGSQGMGWREGLNVGRAHSSKEAAQVHAIEYVPRPALLGLGADAEKALELKNKKKGSPLVAPPSRTDIDDCKTNAQRASFRVPSRRMHAHETGTCMAAGYLTRSSLPAGHAGGKDDATRILKPGESREAAVQMVAAPGEDGKVLPMQPVKTPARACAATSVAAPSTSGGTVG